MSYKSWRPSSRRDRRRQARGNRSRSASAGSDRIFLVIAGLFLVALVAVLVYVAYTTN